VPIACGPVSCGKRNTGITLGSRIETASPSTPSPTPTPAPSRRLTITDLAARVGPSISPCHRRLRELERTGGDPRLPGDRGPQGRGPHLRGLLFVTIRQEDRDTLLALKRPSRAIPNVVQAQRLFGGPDYLLRVVTADLAAYQQPEDDTLAALPGVQRLTSILVMK
jgi:DNA-binding Lrp family transcriptional regulator